MELFHVLSDGPTLNENLNPLPAHVSSYRYCKESLCRHRQLLLQHYPSATGMPTLPLFDSKPFGSPSEDHSDNRDNR